MTTATAAQAIAAFSQRLRSCDIPAPLLRLAGRTLVDTVAVGIAGAQAPASLAALRYLDRLGRVSTGNGATLWGHAGVWPAESAALFNGIAAHVLDYDDVTTPLSGHPSVAMWPALLALGEVEEVPGARLLSAYVLGFEVICRLAKAMNPGHYQRGWHATASIGTIAATAACSHLLALDEEQTLNAIGIAVAEAAGTRANFGSDAKSFQAGQCNASAVRATLLAREGFTASPQALDAPIGYAGLYGNGAELAAYFRDLGTVSLELETSGIEVKKYPLCYGTHRTLDGLLDMRQEHRIRFEDVTAVHVHTSPGQLTPLIHHRPTTGLQAKFSMQYAVGAALHDGSVALASFSDEAVQRKALQEFLPLVHATSAAGESAHPRWSEIDVRLRDGSSIKRRVTTLRGSAQLPLSAAQLHTKVADCLFAGESAVNAASLLEAAERLDQMKTPEFAALLHVPLGST